MRIALLAFALCLSAPAFANSPNPQSDCSSQLLASVIADLPLIARDLDPRQLSCLGLTQVFLIQTSGNLRTRFEQLQDIEAVFRREGLIR
ncbi:MAG: hypothetical protein AAGC82_17435 [Pseudomonadota bacterium]